MRDCSGLGRERAGHVLPPWDPEPGRDKGSAPSLVREEVVEKVPVGGAARNCAQSPVILLPLCAPVHEKY